MRHFENCVFVLLVILSLAGPVGVFLLIVGAFLLEHPTVAAVIGAAVGAGAIRGIVLWVNRRDDSRFATLPPTVREVTRE